MTRSRTAHATVPKSVRAPALIGAVVCLAYAAACSQPTQPGGGTQAGISFLNGAGASDTVGAVLPQALVVEVRDTRGAAAVGQLVRFTQVPSAGAALSVAPGAGQSFDAFVAESTDARGQASVLVRLGSIPGAAQLAISVPAYGLVDTAAFTVQAGRPANVDVTPLDTAISVGAHFQLHAAVVDRYGNPTGGAVSYGSPDSVVRVDTAGLVTGEAGGVGLVVVTAGGAAPDTCVVVVQPAGTIAASVTGGVLFVNFDGTGAHTVAVPTAGSQGRFPTWLSDTAVAAMDGQSNGQLVTVSTSGAVHYVVPPSDTAVELEVWPQAARDGSWIYFAGLSTDSSTAGLSVWRIMPNGDSLTHVSPPLADWTSDTYPSPSPDGTRVVVSTTRFGGASPTLAVIDVATSQITSLGVPGVAPRWAPDGKTIAYLGGIIQSEIWVVDSSGSLARRVSPPGRSYGPGLDWSPDGKWIIARGVKSLELVYVATGKAVLLTNLSSDARQPTWKP